jgi:bifunctional ADP-heptose synthase (sugar kinase/adenylyltransferase)
MKNRTDPKGCDWERYLGATCITPNTREMEVFDGSSYKTNRQLAAAK